MKTNAKETKSKRDGLTKKSIDSSCGRKKRRPFANPAQCTTTHTNMKVTHRTKRRQSMGCAEKGTGITDPVNVPACVQSAEKATPHLCEWLEMEKNCRNNNRNSDLRAKKQRREEKI